MASFGEYGTGDWLVTIKQDDDVHAQRFGTEEEAREYARRQREQLPPSAKVRVVDDRRTEE